MGTARAGLDAGRTLDHLADTMELYAAYVGTRATDADWWWQSAPLAEWDGAPRRRTSPPPWC